MRRREFIGGLGKSLAAVMMLRPEGVFAMEKDSRHLVNTPERRAQYLAKVLKMLCTDIGPRQADTKAYEQAAELIKQEMDLALPVTELDWFPIRGWRLLDEPVFSCGDQKLEIYPYCQSQGTPAEGIRGILKKADGDSPSFTVVDQASGKPLVHVAVSLYGRAIPSCLSPDSEFAGLPVVGAGKQDVPLLEKAAANNTPVHVRFQVEFIPDARSCNIVGTLPGETEEEITFLGHADTMYSTPGANDNTASMVTVLMLAHAVSGRQWKRTMTFVATGAEECGSQGVKHYAAKRAAAGTLQNIKFCVNFDSLTYGPNLYIHSSDEGMKQLIASIHKDLKPHNVHDVSYPIALEYFDRERGMDDAPFTAAGARTLDLNSRGYDEKTLPVYHRPEDTAETVPVDCVENSFLVFEEYIKRIQAL